MQKIKTLSLKQLGFLKNYVEEFKNFYDQYKSSLEIDNAQIHRQIINVLRESLSSISGLKDDSFFLVLDKEMDRVCGAKVFIWEEDKVVGINCEEADFYIQNIPKNKSNQSLVKSILNPQLNTSNIQNNNSLNIIKFETQEEVNGVLKTIVYQQKIFFDLTDIECLDLKNAINKEKSIPKAFVYKYMENHTSDNGLILNTGPTGIGKSFNSSLYILLDFLNKKHVEKNKDYEKKKLFFITNTISNVTNPYLEAQEIIKDFVKKYNLTQNTCDFLLSKIALVNKNASVILSLFDKDGAKKKYKHHALECLISKNDIDGSLKRSIDSIISDLKYIKNNKLNENVFDENSDIYNLTEKLKEVYKKRNDDASIQDEDYLLPLFIGEDATSENKGVDCFFLTTAKAFFGLKKLKRQFKPFEDTTVKNNIYIIDEFDKQAHNILDLILKNKGKHDIQLLAKTLMNLSHFSFKKNEDHSDSKIDDLRIDFVQNKLDPFIKKYSFLNSFELDKDTQQKSLNIFQDNINGILLGKETYAEFNINDNQNTNSIKIVKSKKVVNKNKVNFISFVADLISILNDFVFFIRSAATLYQVNNPILSLSDKIDILLKEMNFDKNMFNFVVEKIIELNKDQFQTFQYKDLFAAEKPIYAIDLNEKDEVIQLKTKSLNFSANTLLRDLAENNLVFAVSATANNESVIKNFNTVYLKEELGDKYHEFSDVEKQELIKERKIFNDDYAKKVKIKIKCPDKKITISDLDQVLLAEELTLDDYDSNGDGHQKQKILQFANATLEFVNSPTSKYMLAANSRLFTSKHTFIIKCLVDKYAKTKKYSLFPEPNKKDNYQVNNKINADFFNNHGLEKIMHKLKDNKVVVYTHYQTIGAGMNLQAKNVSYNTKHYAKINDVRNSNKDEFDIDTIYMAKPTFIFLSPDFEKNEVSISDKVSAIYYLQSLLYVNQITAKKYEELYNDISKIKDKEDFKRLLEYSFYKETEDYFNVIVSYVKQLLGRGSRTLCKNKNETIFIEEDLINVLNKNTIKVEEYDLRSFKELVLFLKQNNNVVKTNIFNNKNFNQENKFKQIKRKMLKEINSPNSPYYNKTIEDWEALRDFVLKNGMFITEKQNQELTKILGCDISLKFNNSLSELRYDVEKKDGEINYVDFTKTNILSNENTLNLNIVRKNKTLLKYFEKNNYVTQFNKSHLALPVILIEDIYKGAIGEAIVRCFIEEYMGITLDDNYNRANNIYEFSDLFINGNVKIGVDAKHYNLDKYKNEYSKELTNKIDNKLLITSNGLMDKMMIINCFGNINSIKYGTIKQGDFTITKKQEANVVVISNLFNENGDFVFSGKELTVLKQWMEN